MKRTTILSLFILLGKIALCQTISIRGKVSDDKGNPVAFVFIKDAQHNYATFSDPNGAFKLNVDPASELIATSNNFEKSIVKIDNQAIINIVMHPGGVASTATATGNAFTVTEIGARGKDTQPLAQFGTTKEELHGSPYLFSTWVHGYAVTTSDSIKQNDSYLFNYEKTTGILLYTSGGNTMKAVTKGEIKGFTLFDDNGQVYTFTDVPAINPKVYVQVLSSGNKYIIYKDINTQFHKADFTTNGITSSGNNYDSYDDNSNYYLVKLPGGTPQKLSLKRKAIKNAFAADEDKVNQFLSANDSEIDDTFLEKLGNFMNN
ncbi:hypothetical protein [Mucilaginibacter sp.]